MDEVMRSWIREVLGADEVRDVQTLTFGISSDMRLIEVDGVPLVLRRYLHEFVNERAASIAYEAQALKAARMILGNLVPEPVARDTTGSQSGCPCLMMTYLPGKPVIHGLDLSQVVQPLALLHARVAPTDFPRYRHWFEIDRLAVPKPSSCSGPRGIDVAHARGNLALVDGVGAAEQFLRAYRGVVPSYDHDPWWDIADLLSFDIDFAGVTAFNAVGGSLSLDLLHLRADEWASALIRMI
jgi:hypothetical protein